MLRRHGRLVATGLRLADLAAMCAAFAAAYLVRDRFLGLRFTGLYPPSDYWPLLAASLLLWVAAASLARVYDAYRTFRLRTELVRLARAMSLVALAVVASAFIFKRHELSRLLVAIFFAIAFAASARLVVSLTARIPWSVNCSRQT